MSKMTQAGCPLNGRFHEASLLYRRTSRVYTALHRSDVCWTWCRQVCRALRTQETRVVQERLAPCTVVLPAQPTFRSKLC
jgi:hypothetical protein